jgi:hypothetical protein
LAVECRNSLLDSVAPRTAAISSTHVPPASSELNPDVVFSGPTAFPGPDWYASSTQNSAVSAAPVASRP